MKRKKVSKVLTAATGTALVAVLSLQPASVSNAAPNKPFVVKGQKVKATAADRECLAKNIYHEAGVESAAGKYAVAQVTINRLREGRWGNTICKVVYAKAQFSWTLSAKKRAEQPKGQLWKDSKQIADWVIDHGHEVPSLKSSTYYHATYVKPHWVKTVARVQQIGQHIFYTKA